MGLLHMLAFPVTGVIWLAEQILEQAEGELYDVDRIRGAMLELEMRYEMGELDERTFEAVEEELLARLRVARERAQAEEGA